MFCKEQWSDRVLDTYNQVKELLESLSTEQQRYIIGQKYENKLGRTHGPGWQPSHELNTCDKKQEERNFLIKRITKYP